MIYAPHAEKKKKQERDFKKKNNELKNKNIKLNNTVEAYKNRKVVKIVDKTAFHALTKALFEISQSTSSSERSATEAMSSASLSTSLFSGRIIKRPLQRSRRARYSSSF